MKTPKMDSVMIVVILWIYMIIDGIETNDMVRLEWKLGQRLPVSKRVDPGQVQDLYCTTFSDSQVPVLLMCPLSKGACVADCKRMMTHINIQCSEMPRKNFAVGQPRIFHYRIKVNLEYAGRWKCQSGASESRFMHLSVTEKPFINSLITNPDPPWMGEPMNITCSIMPIKDYVTIDFYKQSSNGIPIRVRNGRVLNQNNRHSKTLTIPSAVPVRDDNIECMVFKNGSLQTSKMITSRVNYFPQALYINASVRHNEVKKEGDIISFSCGADGGYPTPSLILIRHRLSDNSSTVLLDRQRVTLTKKDNKAVYFCSIENSNGKKSTLLSRRIRVIVEYEPSTVQLMEQPDKPQLESHDKQFICQSDEGSEPASLIRWSVTDALGRQFSEKQSAEIIQTNSVQSQQLLHRDVIRVKLKRKLNGYNIVCMVEYKGKTLAIKKRPIRVYYSPDVVEVNSNPLGAIKEGGSVTLTCLTGSSNPASKIEWFKSAPGKQEIKITSGTYTDLVPSNFSGVQLSSSLKIHGISRTEHGTLFKCRVSHITMSSTIDKTYFLRVLYPPKVTVFSRPKFVEEGDKATVFCRTSGGNPQSNEGFTYRWSFCSVNASYQPTQASLESSRPPPEIRQQPGVFCNTANSASTNELGLPTYPKFSLGDASNGSVLVVSQASSSYRGWYSCSVYSTTARSHSTGYWFLDVMFAPIIVSLSPTRSYWKLGSNMYLYLQVHSNPTSDISIRWFYRPHHPNVATPNNKKIYRNERSATLFKTELIFKPYGRFESVILDNYTVYLKITQIRTSDMGEYSCEISNRLGKRGIGFQVFPASDISVDEDSIRLDIRGRKATILYRPPTQGHFSHLVLRICHLTNSGDGGSSSNSGSSSSSSKGLSSREKSSGKDCRDMQVPNPLSGQVSVRLNQNASPANSIFRLLVYNGSTLLQTTRPYQSQPTNVSGRWVEMSLEMIITVIVGVVGIFILLFVAFITLVLLKCKNRKKNPYWGVNNRRFENGGNTIDLSPHHLHQQHQHMRASQDYFLVNSPSVGTGHGACASAGTNSLVKSIGGGSGCHCFTNYPLEVRSDNGSDHSNQSQNFYHPMMLKRKLRDNGEMNSIHSGGSHQSPDLLLTERTSANSVPPGGYQPQQPQQPQQQQQQQQQMNGYPPNKISFLTGRMQSIDSTAGVGPNLPDEFMTVPSNEMVYAAVEDPLNANQTRIIPIPARNFAPDHPYNVQQLLNQYLATNPAASPYPATATPPIATAAANGHPNNNGTVSVMSFSPAVVGATTTSATAAAAAFSSLSSSPPPLPASNLQKQETNTNNSTANNNNNNNNITNTNKNNNNNNENKSVMDQNNNAEQSHLLQSNLEDGIKDGNNSSD